MTRAFRVDWKAAALQPTHASLIRDLVRFLRLSGWYVLVTPRGGLPGEKGLADLIAFRRGDVACIEAKVGRDKLRPEQIQFREEIERQGFRFIVARSVEELAAAIDAARVGGKP